MMVYLCRSLFRINGRVLSNELLMEGTNLCDLQGGLKPAIIGT